jgi:hypothetical protein
MPRKRKTVWHKLPRTESATDFFSHRCDWFDAKPLTAPWSPAEFKRRAAPPPLHTYECQLRVCQAAAAAPPPQLAVHRSGVIYEPTRPMYARKYADGRTEYFDGPTSGNDHLKGGVKKWGDQWLLPNSTFLPLTRPFKLEVKPKPEAVADVEALIAQQYHALLATQRRDQLLRNMVNRHLGL